jgi:defect-in-organelle-trafficking protein DotB
MTEDRKTTSTSRVDGPIKSTLLASIVAHIAEPPNANETILEYSAPIEYVYDGVEMPNPDIVQTEVGLHLPPDTDDGK